MAGFRELARAHNKLVDECRELARVVDELRKEHAQTRGMIAYFARLDIRKRLRWFLLGKVE